MATNVGVPSVGLLLALLVAATGALGSVGGAYAGTGPSTVEIEGQSCAWSGATHVALRGPASPSGTWGVDLLRVFRAGEPCTIATGFGWFPSEVADGLVGSPETGFSGSGVAGLVGTTTGTVAWSFEMGPVGAGTAWALHLRVAQQGSAPFDARWSGSADLVGAHL